MMDEAMAVPRQMPIWPMVHLVEQVGSVAVQQLRHELVDPERVLVGVVDSGDPDGHAETHGGRPDEQGLAAEFLLHPGSVDHCADDDARGGAEHLARREHSRVAVDKLVVEQQRRHERGEPGVIGREADQEGHEIGNFRHLCREQHHQFGSVGVERRVFLLVRSDVDVFEEQHAQHHDKADGDGDVHLWRVPAGAGLCEAADDEQQAADQEDGAAVVEVFGAEEVVLFGSFNGHHNEEEHDGGEEADGKREIEKRAVADAGERERAAKHDSEPERRAQSNHHVVDGGAELRALEVVAADPHGARDERGARNALERAEHNQRDDVAGDDGADEVHDGHHKQPEREHLVEAVDVAQLAKQQDERAERERVRRNHPGGLRGGGPHLFLQTLGHAERGGHVEVVHGGAHQDEGVRELLGPVLVVDEVAHSEKRGGSRTKKLHCWLSQETSGPYIAVWAERRRQRLTNPIATSLRHTSQMCLAISCLREEFGNNEVKAQQRCR
ncbi:hypothetical protein KL919_004042 [Ogataea angusta]|nr:hypothetical protein KL919_004042 [Ogataea angusta]